MSETKLPAWGKVIWVSPRKTRCTADAVAANIVDTYLLHELLVNVKLPLDELSSAHLVAIEVPPAPLAGFEHDLLQLVAKLRALGPNVLLIVQPSL